MHNTSYLKKITLLSEKLDQLGLLTNLVRKYNYPDEVQIYQYNNAINSTKQLTDGQDLEITAGGFSLNSPSFALLKCVMETAERLSASCYRKEFFIVSSFNNLKQSALNPDRYKNQPAISEEVFSWVLGTNLLSSEKIYLPAQCVYYSYKYLKNEPHLTPRNSTGAAGGFDHESTLLRGIYETVERDAFMSIYLTQIKAPKLKIDNIKNTQIKNILDKCSRYNLDVALFDLTNNLNVPVYLAVVLDKTGLGPPISLGLKSSLRKDQAILGCLEEAVYIRPWMRNEMLVNKKNDFSINPKKITNLKERGLYWLTPDSTKHLNFLLNQKKIDFEAKSFLGNTKEELSQVKKLFKNKGINIFYTDITLFNLNKIGCYFYKVICPELQPMFFYEKFPEIKIERLKNVAEYFNKKTFSINKIPHPFL